MYWSRKNRTWRDKLDKKKFIGVTLILFLVASWSLGNIMFLSPEADNGAQEAELPGYFIWILLISFLLLFIVLVYRSRSTSMFAAILVVTSPWIASYFILRFRSIYTGFLIGIILMAIILAWKGFGRKEIMAGLMVLGGAVLFTQLYDYFYSDEADPLSPGGTGEEAPQILPWDEPGAIVETVFGSWGTFLLFFLIMAFLAFILYQKVKPMIDSGEDEEVEKDLVSAVDTTITELHKGKDVEATILRCYQRMCMILEEKGVEYSDFLTPREFERRAITYLDVPKNRIFDLRGLFEIAKYSDHRLGDEDRERAVKSLKALREEIE